MNFSANLYRRWTNECQQKEKISKKKFALPGCQLQPQSSQKLLKILKVCYDIGRDNELDKISDAFVKEPTQGIFAAVSFGCDIGLFTLHFCQ